MLRRIRNAAVILGISVLAGTLLLTLAFCLPVDRIRENVKASLYYMLEIQEDENGDPDRKALLAKKENFTEALMVQNALEKVEGRNPYEHAMYIYHYDLLDGTTWATEESLITSLNQGTEGMYLREYSKYWHGYLIFLKPLLMTFTWQQLEVFWFGFMLLFTALVILSAVYKKQIGLGLGIAVAFLFMKPVQIMISVDMSVCWMITLAGMLVLILRYEWLRKRDWLEGFFIIVGIATSYMDFLTYPVVTLVMPLCVFLVLDREEMRGIKQRIAEWIWLCLSWAYGYIGMWGMKWLVAEITLQTGTLRNAAWSVITRTEPLDGRQSFFSGVSRTLEAVFGQYDTSIYMVGIVLIIIWLLSAFAVNIGKKQWGRFLPVSGCLLAAAMIPFGWLVLTQNHSAIHCVFTFRVLGASVFAIWCMAVSLSRLFLHKEVENEQKL